MYVCSLIPRPPLFFCFLVCVHYCTWKQKSGSSALVYYTESYPKNKDGGGLGTRLYAWSSLAWKPACILLLYIEVMANFISCWIAVIQVTLPVRHSKLFWSQKWQYLFDTSLHRLVQGGQQTSKGQIACAITFKWWAVTQRSSQNHWAVKKLGGDLYRD